MLHAAHELLRVSFWRNTPPPKLAHRTSYVEWKFERVDYVYFPILNDHIFEVEQNRRRLRRELVLLVSPEQERLAQEALRQGRQRDYFSIFTVCDYLAWRTMFATADANWSNKKVILWWLSRYNRFIRRKDVDRSLIVRLERSNR
jgi:hypothetical protein